MVWSIGDVTLPYGPSDISDDVECDTDELQLDGDEAIVFATAPGIRIVTFSGSICDPVGSPAKRDIEEDYCSILRSYQGTTQDVVNPSGTYTATWYVKKVAFSEVAEGEMAKVSYVITLWLASSVEVM